ncbi:ShlB/FhaC/HecB family hemolysin secretion/activation protein [Burkholderia stagnalis]|uniref:ShlB/FhaC/HecB family hemolysin secretion/activation protein n=1 Tax=Burkholderia stagnalis TaxID=1503054 RepID=UPI000F58EE9C|nr:ShlB/FhaC/HecB family hemolysin secretion/activation protein [Burkholderia stagnalis]RQQ05670.1 ShlB/FhaC/HecB family hemolysin secretion/activation protein [Burkholderia stagnalis]RQQ20066.1 ShlB/FhaC/HecB family hemolysin secretion/activation protein [Burkholderia stagnalis]RQQ37292.1 ShlB/FhaC/HecB family hemolysin secretion/activation protein [Burkholderia stagnalis]RQQ37966.1 ShlB/FhaC/HecB family hemolysin secretion/activation protein [Burkholderia stagnalis]RQQ39149.1 ShlB/FhaC/HecB 
MRTVNAGRLLCAVNLLTFAVAAVAQAPQSGIQPQSAQRHQAQQLDELRQQVLDQPDVLSAKPSSESGALRFPAETPCFDIHEIEWRGADAFPWLRHAVPLDHACIGQNGLSMLREWAGQRLVARGYITSLVSIPPQDLSTGRLIIEVLPGRIGAIDDARGRIGWAPIVFPRGAHALLNVRDLDQALENVRRLPGQSAAAFDLVPGASLGDTDIVVRHPDDARRVRFVATADNGGLDATGRNQLGAIVAIDSPLRLYDQLIVTYNTDAALRNKSLGSQAKSAAWNVPVGYASFSLGISEWTSRQTLAPELPGEVMPPLVQRTRRYEAGVSYVPYRSGHGKTTLRFRLARREDRSWFGPVELDVFRHDIVSYEVSAAHREKLAHATVDASIGMRASLAGLSAFPGRVNGRPEWDGRYRVYSATLGADAPFRIGARPFGYRGFLQLQYAPGALPSTEYLQIGGRYTVRGFDGNQTLAGDSGWFWRNELAAPLFSSHEAYAALDAGAVTGVGSREGAGRDGRTLIGAAFGVRGGYRMLGYDVALGVPLRKPGALQTARPTLDVSLTARF